MNSGLEYGVVKRTNRALTVLVLLQTVNTECSRDADTRRVTGSTCSRSVRVL